EESFTYTSPLGVTAIWRASPNPLANTVAAKPAGNFKPALITPAFGFLFLVLSLTVFAKEQLFISMKLINETSKKPFFILLDFGILKLHKYKCLQKGVVKLNNIITFTNTVGVCNTILLAAKFVP